MPLTVNGNEPKREGKQRTVMAVNHMLINVSQTIGKPHAKFAIFCIVPSVFGVPSKRITKKESEKNHKHPKLKLKWKAIFRMVNSRKGLSSDSKNAQAHTHGSSAKESKSLENALNHIRLPFTFNVCVDANEAQSAFIVVLCEWHMFREVERKN